MKNTKSKTIGKTRRVKKKTISIWGTKGLAWEWAFMAGATLAYVSIWFGFFLFGN